jgi:hypothetical protein
MSKKEFDEVNDNENVNKNINIENIQVNPAKQSSSADMIEEKTIAKKLISLYQIQQICSQIDRIRVVRGELPNEIRDLEDAHEGMQTRIEKYKEDIEALQDQIKGEKISIAESQALIKRYEEQQNNVRNNREYDALTKEIDYQKDLILNAERYIGKHTAGIETKEEEIKGFEEKLQEIYEILSQKKDELTDIIADTEKEEADLLDQYETLKENVDQRLLSAFERIRKGARNGLAIVQIEREACGGCFSVIPPQRQLDIRLHKKIIVCESCGRIFIDKHLIEEEGLA